MLDLVEPKTVVTTHGGSFTLRPGEGTVRLDEEISVTTFPDCALIHTEHGGSQIIGSGNGVDVNGYEFDFSNDSDLHNAYFPTS